MLKKKIFIFIFIFNILIPLVFSATKSYNFSDETNVQALCYRFSGDSPPPDGSPTPLIGSIYSNLTTNSGLDSSDNTDANCPLSTQTRNAIQFKFNIQEAIGVITYLNLSYESSGGPSECDGDFDGQELYFFNYTGNVWVLKDDGTAQGGTDYTFNLNATGSSISDFINSSNKDFDFVTHCTGTTSDLKADYIELIVTYDEVSTYYENFVNNATSNTTINGTVKWDIDLHDNINDLSFWIFAHNQSGTLTNVSNGTLSGTSVAVSTTLNISLIRDNYICGQFWFNNSQGDTNHTLLTESGACFTVGNSVLTTPTLHNPTEGQTIDVNWVVLNYSSTDSDGDNITYYVYADTNTNPVTLVFNGTNTTFNYTDLSEDTYYWKVQADDGIENSSNSSIQNFIIALTAPTISLDYPPNNSYVTNSTVEFNFTATDDNGIDICRLYLNDSGSWSINQTLTSVTSGSETNFTPVVLVEGSYKWNVWCNDTTSTSGFNSSNYTINIDSNIPDLNVSSPVAGTSYSSQSISLTISTYDLFRDKCFYKLYIQSSGVLQASNDSISCNGTTTIATGVWTDLSLNVSVNDSAGQVNSTVINFTTSQPTTSTTTTPSTAGGGGGCASGFVYVKNKCVNETFVLVPLKFKPVSDVDTFLIYRPCLGGGGKFRYILKSNKDIDEVSIEEETIFFNTTILNETTILITSTPVVNNNLFIVETGTLKVKDVFGVVKYVPLRYRLTNLCYNAVGLELWLWLIILIVVGVGVYINREEVKKLIKRGRDYVKKS